MVRGTVRGMVRGGMVRGGHGAGGHGAGRTTASTMVSNQKMAKKTARRGRGKAMTP